MVNIFRLHSLKAKIMVSLVAAGIGLYGGAACTEAAALEVAHIGDIQGAAQYSPMKGKEVKVKGVVTFRDSEKAFFIQDNGDGDDKTSDGILVYAPNSSVGIGDLIEVEGTVEEYFGRGYKGREETDLPITEIKADKVKQLGRSELPKPVVLDVDRKIPRKTIDSDGLKVFNPEKDAIDFWESLEGMRVTVKNPRILGPQRYGEIYVVPSSHEGPYNNCGGLSITADDQHPEHICLQLQGGNAKNLVVKASDRINGDVTGVVTYGFGVYKVETRMNQLPPIVDGGLKPEKSTIKPDPSKLLIASYNIENFSAAYTSSNKVNRLAKSIAYDLNLPDIITVLELQDNDGKDNTGNTKADKSAKYLTDAIKAVSNVTYDFVNINPADNEDGGQPGANIRVAYFYNPQRVQLKSAPAGGTYDAESWQNGHLKLNPGRIDPKNPIFEYTRKSLAAEFTFQGKDLVIIANHLNSKRGDDTLYGSHQPVQLRSEAKRLKLAADIHDFVAKGLAQNPNLNIILTGDFNDHEFSPVIKTLEGSELANVVSRHDWADRYSYFYNGNNQILDNIIVSKNLLNRYTFDIVHVNSPFMEEHGRVSDHDPLEIQLDLN